MKWVPILSAEDEVGAQAWEAINQITQAVLDKSYQAPQDVQPFERSYEKALLYGYLAVANDDLEWANRASACLNEAIDQATNLSRYLGLFGGLAGLGWTIEHVSRSFCDDVEQKQRTNQPSRKMAEMRTLMQKSMRRFCGICTGLFLAGNTT